MCKEQSWAGGREGCFVAQPAAPRLPRPPPGSQGGDELRQLRLLPLLSLGEGPGQGHAIVLPRSCGALGLQSCPSGGHVPRLLCGVRPRSSQEAARPWQVWAHAPGGAVLGTKRHPRATSSQLHSQDLVGTQGDIAAMGQLLRPTSLGKAWGAPRAAHFPVGCCHGPAAPGSPFPVAWLHLLPEEAHPAVPGLQELVL